MDVAVTVDSGDSPRGQVKRHLCLYNRASFSALNIVDGQEYLQFICEHEGRRVATLAGVQIGSRFISGYSAPFGGIDMVRCPERLDLFSPIVHALEAAAQACGINEIVIRCKPDAHSPNDPMIAFALVHAGFTWAEWNLSACIDLADLGSVENWTKGLKSAARGTMRRGLEFPLLFYEANDEIGWRLGYSVLEENHRAKGRQLSLSLDYVLRLRTAFPEHVRMFLLVSAGKAIAATLFFRVSERVGYIMWWGNVAHDLPVSPMNVMAYHMVVTALADGCAVLDLGASTRRGVPNSGTMAFKLSLAARLSARLVLRRTF